jgi:hypothetical protein
LNWANSEELSASTADILFELKAGCPSGGTPGKYTITIEPGEWSAGGSKDSLRRANYVALATICVNSAPQRANDADRKEILLHEMGHAYGLHDRYNTDLTCNSRDVSVMDGVVSCGNGGIVTALDAERVKGFWGYGWPNAPAIGADVAGVPGDNPILSTPSSGVLRATWGDWAWWQTSFYLIVRWQYDWWPVWYTLAGSDRWRDDDVGAHGLMTDYPQVDMRLLEEDFNVQGGPNGAYYTACIASDNYGWGWAPMYCFYSEKVWISW